LIAHYFSSGVVKDGNFKWQFLVQVQQLTYITENQELDYVEGIKLHFLFFSGMVDVLVTSLRNKRFYDVVRPTTAIQCVYKGQTIQSWKGPYQGVQSIPGEQWTAWHNRVNNPTSEYPCEHCMGFAYYAEILKNFFGTDTWLGNNVTVGEGTYVIERKITVGNPGYIAGVTDVPNTGPFSVGYAPATDMPFGWATNTQFSRDCSDSRILYGVHTFHSSRVGEATGRIVGSNVYSEVKKLFDGVRECKVIGAEK